MYYYHCFGLNIKSELSLMPMVEMKQTVPQIFDIEVKVASVCAQGLESPARIKPLSQIAPQELWFYLPDVARFYIANGREIVVEPMPNADEESIRVFLLDSCFGAIMHQRGELVLQGSGIRVGEGSALFMGHTGDGKSTLTAAFYRQGYQVFSDGLAVVDETLKLQPAYAQLKLWPDSMKKLGLSVEELKQVRPQIAKISLPIQEAFCPRALPVKALYLLSSHNQESFIFKTLKGMEKFQPIKNHIYRSDFSEVFGMQSRDLKRLSQLANQAAVVRVSYPNYGFQIDELMRLVEEDMRHKELIDKGEK
ncbi:MAG: hypothetical protein M0P91_03885 [Sulfuricurvum sp.]|jgi:hypothetical protein|uniref:hypothetical protein n=1 Tax=Sulfuricurvum sp. TaxID=2025608 RepID=UPI0025D8678D|nr:hypothetical protein [Sulfuricurvum sp.]MCK9372312.1 hypothetical protein [Sulfuricurvum sp.]